MPKAHVEAPVYGSIILAGILLKIGRYGLVIIYGLLNKRLVVFIRAISISGGVIASFITIFQSDIKSLIAYSRIVHIRIVTMAVIIGLTLRIQLRWLMVVGHGICRSGLFYISAVKYERFGSRRLLLGQGLLTIIPRLRLL